MFCESVCRRTGVTTTGLVGLLMMACVVAACFWAARSTHPVAPAISRMQERGERREEIVMDRMVLLPSGARSRCGRWNGLAARDRRHGCRDRNHAGCFRSIGGGGPLQSR